MLSQWKFSTKLEIKMKLLITRCLILLFHLKSILLILIMSLGNLAENIYNGNVSLDAAKQEQRRMENMLENLLITIWLTMCIKFKKIIFSQTQNNFTKEEKKFSLLLKKIYFHCLDHMFLVKMCGKKKIQVRKNLCQQIQRKVF